MQYNNPEALGAYGRRFDRQRISELRPAWTLEYIDSLSVQDVNDLLGYVRARSRVTR